MLSRQEYEQLRVERDKLQNMLQQNLPVGVRQMVTEQVIQIRGQLKQAHKEQYEREHGTSRYSDIE